MHRVINKDINSYNVNEETYLFIKKCWHLCLHMTSNNFGSSIRCIRIRILECAPLATGGNPLLHNRLSVTFMSFRHVQGVENRGFESIVFKTGAFFALNDVDM